MRVPIRKPGKYTHQKPDPYLTLAKFNELKNKLERMKKSQPAMIIEVKRLAEMGDFSENAAYQIAKGRLRGLNQRMLDIEDHLKTAIIIGDEKNCDTVQLGCDVIVEIGGKKKQYKILGSSETNPEGNVISHNSPIGSALMGHRVGEVVKVQLVKKVVEYRVVGIE